MRRDKYWMAVTAVSAWVLAAHPAVASGQDCLLHAKLQDQPSQPIQCAASNMTVNADLPQSPSMPISGHQAGSSSPPFDQGSQAKSEIGRSTAPVMTEPFHTGSAPPISVAVDQPADAGLTVRAAYATVLKARTRPDENGLIRFDYAGALADGDLQMIKAFIEGEAEIIPETLSADEATVYWANLYNALTLQIVLENYPVKSIREIKSGFRPGPWKRKLVTINGENLSLDNIEHDILRQKYPSPYVHYMVNCASVGCPNLKPGLWQIDTLEADQKSAARDFINSRRGAVVTDKGLKLSSIYKWFKKDFGGQAGVLAHIHKYAGPDLAAAIDRGVKTRKYDYDWSLNE